ncbi:MAG: hypothetical protein K1X74_02210 [Pirellulales bacterium]|nr:hypothetical protein [Pirellulales bacterium]
MAFTVGATTEQVAGQQAAAPPASPPAEPAPAPPPVTEAPAPPAVPLPQRLVRSLVELGQRAVADHLDLTPEQRRRVSEILEARARALEEASPESHLEIERSIEAQLAEILTDQQLARWVAMTEPAPSPEQTGPPGERKLRFSFRYQPWSEVLSWFAEQSDLSLVLDAPPPGTFNYTDSRLYSPAEAIDLLNGVLLTKGYTLIRRERMLMLLKLDEEIPADLIPEVKLDDLDQRGKFELVTVRFPLQGRDPAAVSGEITPLLGPHGKCVTLPQTKQLVVTETAGKMLAISAVIESIPPPAAPNPPEQPKQEEKPTLVVYPLAGADGAAAVKTLEALFAAGRFVHDPKTEQIMAFATPSLQVGIKETLAQMQADEPVEKQYRLEVYSIASSGSPQQLLEMFKALVPDSKVALDPSAEHLAVWATAPQQATIRETLAGIEAGGPEGQTRRVEVYRVEEADLATILATLQTLMPKAKLALDRKAGAIVALALPDEHETIRATISQIEVPPAAGDVPRFETYAVTPEQRERVTKALADMAAELPGIQVLGTATPGELRVRARAKQHELIAAVVEQLAQEVPEALRPQLVVYRLQYIDAAPVVTALAALVPSAKVVVEAKTNQLLIWAAAADQEKVRSTVDQLDVDLPPTRRLQLQVHPLGQAELSTVTQVLAVVAPEAKLISNTTAGTIIILARADDQLRVKETIEGLQPALDDPNRPRIEVYNVRNSDPSSLASALTGAFPKARITADTVGKRLIVYATPDEQATLRPTIEQLQQPLRGADQPKLVSYPVGTADLSATMTLLQQAFVDARFAADTKSNAVVVWAADDVHTRIGEMMTRLATDLPEQFRKSTRAYRFESADPATAMTVLRGLQPYTPMAVDPRSGSLMVTATGQEHVQIAEAVAAIEQQSAGGGKPEVRVYPVRATDPSTLLAALQQMYASRADVRLSLDTKSQKIVAWAGAAEQANIAAAIEQIDQTADNQQTLAVYPLDGADPTSAVTLLQGAMADARFVADTKTETILAWARAEQHPRITELVKQLARDVPPNKRRTSRVYPLAHGDPAVALQVIQPLVPLARMAVDLRNRQLAVSATSEEHEEIATAISELDREGAVREERTVRVYELHEGDPASLLTVLQQMFATAPEVRLSLDGKSHKIIAWAFPGQHEEIRRTLDQLETPADLAQARQVEVYQTGEADAAALLKVVTNLLGTATDARIVPDETNNQLIVFARPSEHATIRATLAQMSTVTPVVDVLPLRVIDPYTAEFAIEELFESRGSAGKGRAPKVEADYDSQQLMVRGTPEQVAEIRKLLAKMGEPLLADSTSNGRKLRVIAIPKGAGKSTLEQLQQLWPQISRNPIRVVTPSAVAPTVESLRKEREADQQPPASDPDPANKHGAWQPRRLRTADPLENALACAFPGDEPPPVADDTAEPAPAEATPTEAAPSDTNPAESAEPSSDEPTETGASPADAPPPVVITVGPDSITIASDDEAALDQLETVLRSLAARAPSTGREFTVFTLKNASANSVADSIDRLFASGFFGFRASGVTVVPDQRLNAIIVQASATELATIEELLKVLDTDEVPASAQAQRPRVLKVHDADAEDVEAVLRDVYKTQLTPRPQPAQRGGGGGGGPRGGRGELAEYVQYRMAVDTALPDMTLSVDPTTNSLVVLAPESLFREVEALVKQLDTAALQSDRTIKVVQLKSAKGIAVQKVLEDILRDRNRGRGRSRQSSGN